MIKGKDFILNADTIFKTETYDFADTDISATCLGATKKYQYDAEGNKTDVQIGWTYKVYVAARDLMINVGVEDLDCAVDITKQGISLVNFINFRATFYVDRNGRLQLSCKADTAERGKQ